MHPQAAAIFISDEKWYNICQMCIAEHFDARRVVVSAVWEEERQ